MNKVINGKMYDTATATKIVEWDLCKTESLNSKYLSDNVTCTNLEVYKKNNGEYFCVKTTLDSDSGFINALSEEEAKNICAEALSGDEYVKLFGPVEE